MRNTGIICSSAERTPTVLPEMAELLPPLTGEQLAALEADILKNGCYSPVIVNEDMVVIDGHNRQSQQQQQQRQQDNGNSGDFLQKLRLGLFSLEDFV